MVFLVVVEAKLDSFGRAAVLTHVISVAKSGISPEIAHKRPNHHPKVLEIREEKVETWVERPDTLQ